MGRFVQDKSQEREESRPGNEVLTKLAGRLEEHYKRQSTELKGVCGLFSSQLY